MKGKSYILEDLFGLLMTLFAAIWFGILWVAKQLLSFFWGSVKAAGAGLHEKAVKWTVAFICAAVAGYLATK